MESNIPDAWSGPCFRRLAIPCQCRVLPRCLLACFLALPSMLPAADIDRDREALIYPESNHRLQIDYGRASGANEDIYGEYSQAIDLGTLRAGLGFSEVDTDEGELYTRTFLFGVEGMLSDHAALDLSYQSWGDPGDLTSDTFALAAKWYGEQLVATIEGSLRRITFYTFLDDPRDDRISGTGNGLRLAMSYYGSWGWDVAAEVQLYEYSLDMRQFDLRFSDTLLTNRALELSGSFLDSNTLLELGFTRAGLRTALTWEYSISAIDGSPSNTGTLSVRYERPTGESLGLQLGRSLASDGYASNFGRLSLGYRW